MSRLPSARLYHLVAALAAVGSFGLVWAWVALMPLAYLDPEYPSWRAKLDLLQRCDLGEVLVLGDSRAAADVLHSALPVKATNLAVGGGKSIEAYAAMKRALRCPVPPRRVIISLDAGHFMHPDLFWERSVRFGFLDAADVADVARTATELGDWGVFQARQTDGLPTLLRGTFYAWRLPPLYFANLLQGGVFLRWWRNTQLLQAALAARGQYYFGTDPGSNVVAVDAHLQAFQPLPVLDRYFDRLLMLLDEHHIPADFVSMPMNDATWQQVRPDFRAAFAAYLTAQEQRHPGFHRIGPAMLHWPNRYFGDAFSHLNPPGAAVFSAILGRCLRHRMADEDNSTACQSEAFSPQAVRSVSAAAGGPAQHAE